MSTLTADVDALNDIRKLLTDHQNRTDAALREQRDDVIGLKRDYGTLGTDMKRLGSQIESLMTRFDDSRKTNWPVIAVLAGLIPVCAGAATYVISSQIQTSTSPIQSQIDQIRVGNVERDHRIADLTAGDVQQSRDLSNLTQQSTINTADLRRNTDLLADLNKQAAASSVADASSKTDRQQLNDRVRAIEASIASGLSERRGQVSEINARLLEIEQQFHATSNISNMRWAEQMRQNAMTFEKLHPGERYPTETFYPASIFQAVPSSVGK